jgi:hypothetical protein
MIRKSLFILLLLITTASFAQETTSESPLDRPTPDEAKKFLNYYYKGKGTGPILVEHKFCDEIFREGENKNECKNEVKSIKAGESGLVWMLFTAPSGDKYENIIIQFKRGDLVRSARKVSIDGSLRYRVWTKFKPDKEGDWSIKVLHEGKNSKVETLGDLTLAVTKES